MKQAFFAVVWLFCILTLSWAQAAKTIMIKEETPDLDVQIKYPQEYNSKAIDSVIKTFIESVQKKETPPVDKSLPADVPGKNGLYIDYVTEFKNQHVLSLVFTVSTYYRGAAHPNNTLKTFNFIQGKLIEFNELFIPDSHYLTKIADLCRKEITRRKISDKNWIAKGTAATEENYKNWHFTKHGLAIEFDTYQVAPYVYGPQTVEIAKADLKQLLNEQIIKTVWGSHE